jgi:hypothetical protein
MQTCGKTLQTTLLTQNHTTREQMFTYLQLMIAKENEDWTLRHLYKLHSIYKELDVVLTQIGNNFGYLHGLHFLASFLYIS